MKYCFTYQKHNLKLMKQADEILINYQPQDTTFEDFLELYKEKRIIVNISPYHLTQEEIEKLNAFYIKYNNFVLRLEKYEKEKIDLLKMPFFLTTLVDDWDTFHWLLSIGVSDIYIVNILGFYIKECSKLAHEKNIKIRVFPNIAQHHCHFKTSSITDFFIRPDDLDLYEPYIDIFEFTCYNKEQEEALWKIYKDKTWFGKLNEIIIGLDSEIDNRAVLEIFGEKRLDCKKQCFYLENCSLCKIIEDLSKTMTEKNYYIEKEKKENGIKR